MSTAVVIGAGSGLSASLARKLADAGHDVVLAARNVDKLSGLVGEVKGRAISLEGADPDGMKALFDELEDCRVAVYNPSARVRGPIAELDPQDVRRAMEVTAFGAFLMGQQAARLMVENAPIAGCRGTILFTGASAGVKGFPNSASFAMGKFAQRGLAQSMARELHPKGVHVAWVNIDGGIANANRPERTDDGSDRMLHPDAVAETYMQLIGQHRSAWSNEATVRPWLETF